MAEWGKVTAAVHNKRGEINALHTKAFTAWMNSVLRSHDPPIRINDCTKQLSDGIVLIALIEVLTGVKCEKPYKIDVGHAQRPFLLDNASVALEFASRFFGSTLRVSAADLVDGNVQVILGMLWRFILKFQNVLKDENSGQPQGKAKSVVKQTKEARDRLMKWIEGKVGHYPHVNVTSNPVETCKNGMALCALVHAYAPNVIAYDQLDPNRAIDNLALAFELAEEHMGIPRMLDPQDVANCDDKAMMVYLMEFPKAFLAKTLNAKAEAGEEARAEEERRAEEARRAEELARRQAAEAQAQRRAREDEEARRQAQYAAEEEARRQAQYAAEEEARRQAQYAAEEEAKRRAAADEEARRQAAAEEARRAAQLAAEQAAQNTVVMMNPGSSVGILHVTVVEARNLKSVDLISQSANPYVNVQVERQKERSHKDKHTLNPRWDAKFQFYVSEAYATVDVSVFDQNKIMKDEFLGKIEIPVKGMTFDVPVEQWYTLQPLHTGRSVSGEVYLKLLLTR